MTADAEESTTPASPAGHAGPAPEGPEPTVPDQNPARSGLAVSLTWARRVVAVGLLALAALITIGSELDPEWWRDCPSDVEFVTETADADGVATTTITETTSNSCGGVGLVPVLPLLAVAVAFAWPDLEEIEIAGLGKLRMRVAQAEQAAGEAQQTSRQQAAELVELRNQIALAQVQSTSQQVANNASVQVVMTENHWVQQRRQAGHTGAEPHAPGPTWPPGSVFSLLTTPEAAGHGGRTDLERVYASLAPFLDAARRVDTGEFDDAALGRIDEWYVTFRVELKRVEELRVLQAGHPDTLPPALASEGVELARRCLQAIVSAVALERYDQEAPFGLDDLFAGRPRTVDPDDWENGL